MNAGEAIAVLRERARTYPPERYPVQHATAKFHLGVALTEAGRPEEAEQALETAVGLFDADALPAEHATASNALGVALRVVGRLDEAGDAFRRALAGFERAGKGHERAAALYNLGLVEAQRSRPREAVPFLEAARQAFEEGGQPAAAAAARELGAALLTGDDLDQAARTFAEALDRSDDVGDMAGAGAAANLLGLAHLAAKRPREAVDAFRRAAAAHPRRLRAEGHAVAKANLALAWARAGERYRALLAAGQALAVPGAPAAAREVALEAAGGAEPPAGALGSVVVHEDAENRPGVIRDELNRWLDSDDATLAAEATAWVRAVLDHPGEAVDLLAAWFGTVLELPPSAMERLLDAVVAAVSGTPAADQQTFRHASARAMAAFAPPQLLRLHDTIERLAQRAGIPGSWR